MSLFDFRGNEIRDWSVIPSEELWRYMIGFSCGDKHAAEMEFRKVMKHRNVSQFKAEKMLDAYLGTGDSIDLKPQSLLDIYEQGTEDVHIIPDFLIAGQVTLLHGHSGSGKSTLTKQAIRSVLMGDMFLGRSVDRGDVLLIGLDESKSWTAKTLMEKMELPEADAKRLHLVDDLPGDGVESLRQYLNGHPATRLVVIDTLQSFCNVENINDNSEVGRVLQKLRDVLKVCKHSAVLLIHHSNKTGGFLGAQVIKGSCDIQYRFEMDEREEHVNHLICEKWRTIERQPKLTLRWDEVTHLYAVTEGKQKKDRKTAVTEANSTRQTLIFETLQRNPDGLSKRALHSNVGGRWDGFVRSLDELVLSGTVALTAGKYRHAARA